MEKALAVRFAQTIKWAQKQQGTPSDHQLKPRELAAVAQEVGPALEASAGRVLRPFVTFRRPENKSASRSHAGPLPTDYAGLLHEVGWLAAVYDREYCVNLEGGRRSPNLGKILDAESCPRNAKGEIVRRSLYHGHLFAKDIVIVTPAGKLLAADRIDASDHLFYPANQRQLGSKVPAIGRGDYQSKLPDFLRPQISAGVIEQGLARLVARAEAQDFLGR